MNKKIIIQSAILMVVIISLAIMAIFIERDYEQKFVNCKYHVSDMVTTVVGNQKGQVNKVYPGCAYSVRLINSQNQLYESIFLESELN